MFLENRTTASGPYSERVRKLEFGKKLGQTYPEVKTLKRV